MASSSLRKGEPKQPSESFYYAEEPHLIMPVLAADVENGKLEIPVSFMRRYKKELPDLVNLKVQNHEASRVELSEVNQTLWLGKGVDEFLFKYSITSGHLLAFKFLGNSSFEVRVFDDDLMEREYPDGASQVSRIEHPAFVEHNDEFKSKYYPHIRIPMLGGFMKSGSVNISRSFLEKAKMNRKKGFCRDVTLIYMQKSWTVQLIYTSDGRGRLCRGWEAFLEANSHHAGETILLEHCRTAEGFNFKVAFCKNRG